MHWNIKAFAKFAVIVSVVGRTVALDVDSINDCPSLSPRSAPAADVRDLRPDDIKVTAALGDSIMAGFAAKGIQGSTILNISSLYEYRGVSYGIGGDTGTVTMPNLIKNYNPNVTGPSIGYHLAELCYGPFCPPFQYHPSQDILNAAQSGAMALDLDHELDYLLPAIKSVVGIDYENDWKLLNIQIGSNDQCASCVDSVADLLGPDKYGQHVEAAIERIRNTVPNVLINLIGTFNVTGVYTVTANQSYCLPFKPSDFKFNTIECPCALSDAYRVTMNDISIGYNQQLKQIYQKYQSINNASFAVKYTPAPIDIASFPIDGHSNIDCFHPSQKGHEWVAKVMWNGLFTPLDQQPSVLTWNSTQQIYCPTDADRLVV